MYTHQRNQKTKIIIILRIFYKTVYSVVVLPAHSNHSFFQILILKRYKITSISSIFAHHNKLTSVILILIKVLIFTMIHSHSPLKKIITVKTSRFRRIASQASFPPKLGIIITFPITPKAVFMIFNSFA